MASMMRCPMCQREFPPHRMARYQQVLISDDGRRCVRGGTSWHVLALCSHHLACVTHSRPHLTEQHVNTCMDNNGAGEALTAAEEAVKLLLDDTVTPERRAAAVAASATYHHTHLMLTCPLLARRKLTTLACYSFALQQPRVTKASSVLWAIISAWVAVCQR